MFIFGEMTAISYCLAKFQSISVKCRRKIITSGSSCGTSRSCAITGPAMLLRAEETANPSE
jgi:hypothetical protein